MEKNENITQGQDTHVGYGRNRGDGSDSQNQQPVDSLQRYADQSDSFVGRVSLETKYKDNEKYLGWSFIEVSRDVYKKVLSENANIMFEKAPPQFKDALNALVSKKETPCDIQFEEGHGNEYIPAYNEVRMTKEYFMNNGSPYHGFWDTLMHEYSHAIDFNLGDDTDPWDMIPSSALIKLQSTGGLTLLESAFDELGGDGMYADYEELVNENSASRESKEEFDRLSKQKDEDYRTSMDIALDAICSKYGYDRKAVEGELSGMGYPKIDDDSIDFVMMFVDDGLKEGIEAWFKDDSFKGERERSKEFADRLAEDGRKLLENSKRAEDTRFENAIKDSREFSRLNDIMSAVNGGKEHPTFGYGHDRDYFANDSHRATEIFAEIGPILAKDGKAAEWLKKKAPKLVAGYYELLGLALNKFKER